MTFELFTIICFIATIVIVPVYMWLLYNIKNSWTKNSHDTTNIPVFGVTWMDPIIKKIRK